MRPRKVCPGYESTVKVASCSRPTLPMSASSTLVSTCILVRSWAIRNSVGACSEAATVCPTSTLRETTTPSTGARINVRQVQRGLFLSHLGFRRGQLRLSDLQRGLGGVHASSGSLQLGHRRIIRRLCGVALLLRDSAFPEE